MFPLHRAERKLWKIIFNLSVSRVLFSYTVFFNLNSICCCMMNPFPSFGRRAESTQLLIAQLHVIFYRFSIHSLPFFPYWNVSHFPFYRIVTHFPSWYRTQKIQLTRVFGLRFWRGSDTCLRYQLSAAISGVPFLAPMHSCVMTVMTWQSFDVAY